MKGIILAGGSGTRLFPLTTSTSKQLLPVYDKPMVYYPLSILMLSHIKDILLITTPEHIENYKNLLGNGDRLGIKIKYQIQPKPDGLAQAFLLGEKFIGNDSVCLILGDNIFYGSQLPSLLKKAVSDVEKNKIAKVFGYYVNDPERYGVVSFNEDDKVIDIANSSQK